MRQVWSLQYLRAIAGVGVVVYHVLAGTARPFPLGAAGVDIFFVLSGFLMFALTRNRPVTPVRFLLDRVARIVPLYWLATLAVFAAAWVSRNGIHLVGRSPTLLLQSLLFVPRGPSVGGSPIYPTLFVGWTLDYEMFFYLVFGLMLTVRPWRRIALMSVVFVALVCLGPLIRPIDGTLAADTNPIILEFLEGAWIAALFGERDLGRLSNRALALGLLAVVAFPLVLHAEPRSGFAFLAVALVVAALLLERARLVPEIGPLRFLGDASYSIYLFQILAFWIADVAMARAAAMLRVPFGQAAAVLCECGAAIGLGAIVHVAVERKLLRGTRRLVARVAHVPPRIAEAS